MLIDRFRHDDVAPFLALASTEGWICDSWEFEFLLRTFPQGCLVCRTDDGPAAFVTSIKYARSGWIGNLLVRHDLRGRGIGSMLMERAFAVLVEAGTKIAWLTASEQGKSLYERAGFVTVDLVKRWVGKGMDPTVLPAAGIGRADIVAMDKAGWGDRRAAIIDAVCKRGTVFVREGGFLVSQQCGDGIQLGPWGCFSWEVAAALLDDALASAGAAARVFLDVPVGNVAAAALLHARGFEVCGSNALMYLGAKPAYHPARIFALASMGSMG